MLKLILLDFDGTIADTFREVVRIFNQYADKYGFNAVDENDILKAKSMNVFQFLKFVNIPKRKLPFLLRKGKATLYNNLDKVETFSGIREMLEWAEANSIPCGVVTSNSKKNVERFIQINNLPNIHFVRSSSKIFGKAREFKRITKKMNLRKEELVYIGDEIRDIDAAHDFGIDVIAVAWGYNSRNILEEHKPDHLVENSNQFMNAIQSIA